MPRPNQRTFPFSLLSAQEMDISFPTFNLESVAPNPDIVASFPRGFPPSGSLPQSTIQVPSFDPSAAVFVPPAQRGRGVGFAPPPQFVR